MTDRPMTGELECPFCGHDPFHYENNGVGLEAVAVTCCDLGNLYFRGARPVPDDVSLTWEEFTSIANALAAVRGMREALEEAFRRAGDPEALQAWVVDFAAPAHTAVLSGIETEQALARLDGLAPISTDTKGATNA